MRGEIDKHIVRPDSVVFSRPKDAVDDIDKPRQLRLDAGLLAEFTKRGGLGVFTPLDATAG